MTDLRERMFTELPPPEPGTTVLAPRGKRCTQCLCCDAEIQFEGEFLCGPCDDGTHPPPAEVRAAQPQPVPPSQSQAAATAAYPEKGTTMTTKTKGKGGKRTSEEVRAAILAEPASVSNCEVARRHGVSEPTARNIRLAAGIRSTATHGPRSAANPQPEAIAEQRERTSLVLAAHAPDGDSVTIPVKVNHRLLDSWFQPLSLETKAGLFADNYAIRVEGTVA
jgi:transposase-like protein